MERRNFIKTVTSGALAVGFGTLSTQAITASPLVTTKSSKPVLKFRENGRFRIMQVTDIHLKTHEKGYELSLDLMRRAFELGQPDLIVLTGDNVMSKQTDKAWEILTDVLAESKIPWAIVFGNHDQEYALTKAQIIKILKKKPYNLTENGPENIPGNGNYVLKIGSSKRPDKVQAALYCLDSKQLQTVIPTKTPISNYDWISFEQIAWYREQSRKLTAQNGGTPLPALAFFHIPLPEYGEVLDKPATVGACHEKLCPAPVNSGLFTSFCECKDVMGVFVGHDHTNNFIGSLHNICLAYGYVSGAQASKGFREMGSGVRMIELIEGERRFDSWVLQLCETGPGYKWTPLPNEQVTPQLQVSYPESFIEK
jgi:hypothetical protein